jgi:hypothetical protein
MRCLRFHVIRVTRNPIVRHTSRFVERHVVQSSVASFVPTLLNEAVVHHQKITPDRIIQVASDDVSVTVTAALMTTLLIQTGISLRAMKPEDKE